jgi:hypothetical protein
VLLTSVFGPYAQDDEYGSRAINPMELYHNQVTRVQRAFSVRMFHRSWGLMLIQANIRAQCTLLDFPSLDRFIEQITANRYDIVGISAIMPNVEKVGKMCELVREHQPQATIVVGGHIANMPDLNERIDADHIVRGEGVRWMRRFLSEDESQPIRHPHVLSGFGARTAGVTLRSKPGDVAAILIPSVGCPLGCSFCATSAMFGGKGKFVHFYETGDELFEVMCELEQDLNVSSFFVMDENFLLYRKRALRLLELMEEHDKSWALYVFSSANVLRSYTIEQLVGLGVSWVWVGLEGKDADFAKLRHTDTRELVRTLQSHGIRVLGSSIIGLEEHTTHNIDDAIEYAVSHNADFHQFMLYTPIPGTPLHEDFQKRGALLEPGEFLDADIHGQLKFNFRHPHIAAGQETEFLLAPGVSSRLRSQRPEHQPAGPHHAPGVAAVQEPPRPQDSSALRQRGARPGGRSGGGALGRSAVVPPRPRAVGEDRADPEGRVPRVRPAVSLGRAGCRPIPLPHDPTRGPPSRPRLDLRAAHPLRNLVDGRGRCPRLIRPATRVHPKSF